MSGLLAVFQIGSLGDSIVSLPALLSLRELVPESSEYLLVSKFDSKLKVPPSHVFDMAWKPKHLINYEGSGSSRGAKELWSIASLISQILYYRPRYCVYLMPSDRSQNQVDRDKLFFKAGGVKELIGFRALTGQEKTPGAIPSVNDTEAYLRFRRIWNGEADARFDQHAATPLLKPREEANDRVKAWLTANRRRPDSRLVAMCPFSNYTSKDVPDDTIVNLLPRLEKLAHIEVVLLGGKKDAARARAAIERAGTGLNACGAFSLEESAALLKRCSLALCADSGPMHLAGALGIPSLVAFSRINKQLPRWFPLGRDHTILYREPECAGCKTVTCPVEHHPCMRDITADQILSAALSKLNGLPVAPGVLDGTTALAW